MKKEIRDLLKKSKGLDARLGTMEKHGKAVGRYVIFEGDLYRIDKVVRQAPHAIGIEATSRGGEYGRFTLSHMVKTYKLNVGREEEKMEKESSQGAYVADVADKGHIPMARWGQDHWSTFCYLETCAVDRQGKIDNRRMRCNPRLHRHFAHMADATVYPTRCKGSTIDFHDDWSCVEDMVAEGLLEASSDTKPGQPFGNGRATAKLTDLGWKIAGQLRRHRAEGGQHRDFVPKEELGL
jgi:hypothetical protein